MNQNPRKSAPEGGFTLIELLTVISIIALLSAIIFPVVGSVKQASRETANLSNIRQVAAVLNMMASENNNRYPDAGNYNDPVTGKYIDHWKSPVGAYMNGTPSALNWVNTKSIFVSPTAANPVNPSLTTKPCHYSLNPALTSSATMGDNLILRTNVSRPGEVILVADGAQTDTSGMNAGETFYYPAEWAANSSNTKPLTDKIPAKQTNNVDSSAGRGYLRYRNRNKVHAAMVDGSAHVFKFGEVTYGNIIAAR